MGKHVVSLLEDLASFNGALSVEKQYEFLIELVQAFKTYEHPRLKPLEDKLRVSLQRVVKSAEASVSPDNLAAQFAEDLADLRLQTFELLLTVMNQVRASMKVALQSGGRLPGRLQMQDLERSLGTFSIGLRKAIHGYKKGDASQNEQANRLLIQALQVLTDGHNAAR